MNSPLPSLLEPIAGIYLFNVVVGSTIFVGLGWLAARLLAVHSAPLRQGVLFAALVLVLFAPVSVAVCQVRGFGVFGLQVAAPPDQGHDVSQHVPERGPVVAPPAESAGPIVEASGGIHLPAIVQDAAKRNTDSTTTEPALVIELPRLTESAVWRWLVVFLASIWGLGAIWQMAVLARGLWLVRRLRRSLRQPSDSRWPLLADKAARAVGLRQCAEVTVSELLSSPVSFGILRPVVVIPVALERMLEEIEMEGVLMHESAHIARGDHLTGLFQRLVKVLFWWHPLVHNLCRALDEVTEELCDNHVIQAQGDGRAFAHCLVRLADWACCAKTLPMTVGVLGGRTSLMVRIANLLRKDTMVKTRMNRTMTMALTFFVLVAGGLTAACTVKAAAQPDLPLTLANRAADPTEKAPRKQAETAVAAVEPEKAEPVPPPPVVAGDGKQVPMILPVGGVRIVPGIPGLPGIRIVPPTNGVIARFSTIKQDLAGNRSVSVQDSKRKVEITEGVAGIVMSVTDHQDGKDIVKEYKAKDAADLEKTHPVAHKIYTEIFESGTPGPAGVRVLEIEFGGFDENGRPRIKIDGVDRAIPAPSPSR